LIAQRDITRYLSLAPGNLAYSRSEKAYLATSIIKPQITSGEIGEYLSLDAQTGKIHALDTITQIAPPAFKLDPTVIRPVLQAIRTGQGVTLRYRSLTQPKGSNRTLYPHNLVNSVFRWHVRAYCADREEFRDFNLARIANTLDLTGSRPVSADPDNDWNWHETVHLQLAPNSYLSEEEQALLAQEFSMRKGRLSVPSRGALVPYTLHAYQVDPSIPDSDNPQRNRLILINKADLEQFLWS
jgi:predicted DNA-binding transcriptional regulator YafY